MAGTDTKLSVPIASDEVRFLAHRLRGVPRRYRMSPIDEPRPVTGATRAEVWCDECGKLVRFALRSPLVHRRWQLRRLLIVWVAVFAAQYAAYLLLAWVIPQYVTAIAITAVICQAPVVLFCLTISVFTVKEAPSADGARLLHPSWPHSARTRRGLHPYGAGDDVWYFRPDTTFRDCNCI